MQNWIGSGIAACHIEGVTLHSFAGIGLGKKSSEVLVSAIQRNESVHNRWLATKVLIIDEGQII
jgi:ATP-dependent DNA helicase PIF1